MCQLAGVSRAGFYRSLQDRAPVEEDMDRKFEKEKPLNCMCANSKLSQQRGSPHVTVPNFVPTQLFHGREDGIV